MSAAGLRAGLVLAALLGGCADDEQVQALEAEREALLSSTVPKDEYWEQVARKGEILRDLRPIETEISRLVQRAEALEPQLDDVRARIGEAEGVNARVEQEQERLREALANREGRVAELEAFNAPEASAP